MNQELKLNSRISEIKGIGKLGSMALNQRGIKYAQDLLWIFPKQCCYSKVLNEASEDFIDEEISLNLTITAIISGSAKGKKYFTLKTTDQLQQEVLLVFFMYTKPKIFYPTMKLCVYGTLQKDRTAYKIVHPTWSIGHQFEYRNVNYNIKGASNTVINRAVNELINNIDKPEWLDLSLLKTNNWPSFKQALFAIHNPVNARAKAMERLKFDEACAYELKIKNTLNSIEERNPKYIIENCDIDDLNFGFTLTQDQIKVWNEIKSDLKSDKRMLRLLYGDVGSGKTIIAFLAAISAYKSGKQAAILVPTQILAQQHHKLMETLFPEINTILLTSNESKKKGIYDRIQNEICIIIGTHALIQEKVKYQDLGLLVIDEQHRFGVMQRIIRDDTLKYNVLLMTATPIPRTLKLSLIGHIPISQILTRPQNHRSIDVKLVGASKLNEVIEALDKESDDKIFWVCPNIRPETKREGMDVHTRKQLLEPIFPGSIGLLHGRMSNQEKEQSLNDFINSKTKVLVATTVIEVGINIPTANTIIIENSELFGMAQLYQLMGRVGRGDKPGKCFFVYKIMGQDIRRRLLALKNSASGLELAEHDMKIRGWGTILGTMQNGDEQIGFKCIDLDKDYEIFELAMNYTSPRLDDKNFCETISWLHDVLGYLSNPFQSG